MTTNNPPIAAWAPSTALAKLASRHNNSPCVLTDGPAEFNDVALVRLSDYQRLQADHKRLQAECEKLRKDAERYWWLRRGGNDDIGVVMGFDGIDCGSTSVAYTYEEDLCGERMDTAIDAAMEGDKP